MTELTAGPALRKSWRQYFMDIALQVATRATCDRQHIGAVLVLNRCIVSTGYNGAPAGAPHCDAVGHDMENSHCIRGVHAEKNAIALAAKCGHRTDGATAYVTAMPCWSCYKDLVNAGIKEIYYRVLYRPDDRVLEAARTWGIPVLCLPESDVQEEWNHGE